MTRMKSPYQLDNSFKLLLSNNRRQSFKLIQKIQAMQKMKKIQYSSMYKGIQHSVYKDDDTMTMMTTALMMKEMVNDIQASQAHLQQ